MFSAGAAPRAAVPVSKARVEASRRNGARSRGPKTPEGMLALERRATKPAALAPGAPLTDRLRQPAAPQPTDAKREANRERVPAYTMPNEPEPVRTLHEAAARWNPNEGAEVRNPNEPETRGSSREIAQHASQPDPVRPAIACCPTG